MTKQVKTCNFNGLTNLTDISRQLQADNLCHLMKFGDSKINIRFVDSKVWMLRKNGSDSEPPPLRLRDGERAARPAALPAPRARALCAPGRHDQALHALWSVLAAASTYLLTTPTWLPARKRAVSGGTKPGGLEQAVNNRQAKLLSGLSCEEG